jgi:Ca-activated chloride channel family protein
MGETGFTLSAADTGKPCALAMQRLWLTGQILPTGARLWVQHEFQSAERKPMEAVYGFVLPRDAAMRRFKIEGEGFRVDSELRRTADASKLYEDALAGGSLAALARQYGDGIVNLSVGNIRPKERVLVTVEILAGVELSDDALRFRFPFTLAPTYHARAKAIAVDDDTGEIELPADIFGDLILPPFKRSASQLHAVGFDLTVEAGAQIEEILSPSHAIRVRSHRVQLTPDRDVPDRDLVLEAKVERVVRTVCGGARFAVAVPSTFFGEKPAAAKRVVILLDRSGSMEGAPITQAKKAIEACLGALGSNDTFGIVAFDNVTEDFRPNLLPGTRENRAAAAVFLKQIEARGGTELAAGVEAAATLLGKESGNVLILTDGEVSETETILARARATGMRIHCLGIGSASQDRFLAQLATQTGGVSRFLTPRERVDMAAVDLFASLSAPVASDIRAEVKPEGSVEIEPPANAFAGNATLIAGQGAGVLILQWTSASGSGRREVTLSQSESRVGETLRLLEGARKITDLESRLFGKDREASRIRERLQQLSEKYGLASREMSLVAVVKRAGDKEDGVPKTVVVPVGLAQDTEFGGYFGSKTKWLGVTSLQRKVGRVPTATSPQLFERAMQTFTSRKRGRYGSVGEPTKTFETQEDLLMELAAMLEPDGGIPGSTEEWRIANSLAALLFFLQTGNTRTSGTFRAHVDRLWRFLESHGETKVLQIVATEKVQGDWLPHAQRLLKKGAVDLRAFRSDLQAKYVNAD